MKLKTRDRKLTNESVEYEFCVNGLGGEKVKIEENEEWRERFEYEGILEHEAITDIADVMSVFANVVVDTTAGVEKTEI